MLRKVYPISKEHLAQFKAQLKERGTSYANPSLDMIGSYRVIMDTNPEHELSYIYSEEKMTLEEEDDGRTPLIIAMVILGVISLILFVGLCMLQKEKAKLIEEHQGDVRSMRNSIKMEQKMRAQQSTEKKLASPSPAKKEEVVKKEQDKESEMPSISADNDHIMSDRNER